MTRARLLSFAGLVAVAAAAALFVHLNRSPPAETSPSVAVPPAVVPVPLRATPDMAATGAPTAHAVQVKLPIDPMAANFAATDDLLAFIEGIHESARLGDGASAYYLYRALYRCQIDYQSYFGPDRHERTLDESLARDELRNQFGEEEIRRMHAQCQRLRESDLTGFGPRDEWLPKAANAGYPRAQAEWAFRLTHEGSPVHGSPDVESMEKARELARAAVSSKDPAVFVPVSAVIDRLADEGVNSIRGASWFVAACQRGFDCGPRSEMTRILCRFDTNCQPYESTLDLLRRGTGNDFEAIERGALEINAAIDAGRFDELGL